MNWLAVYLMACVVGLMTAAWQSPILWGFERLTSRYPLALRTQLRGVVFVLAVLPISIALSMLIVRTIHYRPPPLDLAAVPLLIGHPALLTAISAIIFLLLTDLAYYWAHRAQHAVPWLWRFHSAHHSTSDLSALNNYAHWTEPIVQLLLKATPVALLIRLYPGDLGAALGVLISLHQGYIHSTSRLNLGRWSWLINDNVRHRIHHSVEPAHFNKNFGIEFGFWDHLFGTAYVPRRDEWPDTGLADLREPEDVGELLAWSFVRRLPRERLRHS